MARYVIANRRAGKFSPDEKIRSRSNMSDALNSISPYSIVNDINPSDPLARRISVVNLDQTQLEHLLQNLHEDVIFEPEILFSKDVVLLSEFRSRSSVHPLTEDPNESKKVRIEARSDSGPIEGANVKLFILHDGQIRELSGASLPDGTVDFLIPKSAEPKATVVIPKQGFWTMIARDGDINRPVVCPPLPKDGPLGWWHGAIGINQFERSSGFGIRVGVADTGLGPHPGLRHVIGVGAFLDGKALPPSETTDVDAHGTHISGIICARPDAAGDYAGVAPGCEMFVARIFSSPESKASNADIANAVDCLSREHQVDLINLSLGSTDASQIVWDAITDALERGTLCICAAGNDASDVNYPAAFSETIGVTALGMRGHGPIGSLTSSRTPTDSSLFGVDGYFAANFTSRGPQTDCTAPGVGIIATVPSQPEHVSHFNSFDGTSMASPVLCGALAVLLSNDSRYRQLPRDVSRSRRAHEILREHLRNVNLPTFYQGGGLISMHPLVST